MSFRFRRSTKIAPGVRPNIRGPGSNAPKPARSPELEESFKARAELLSSLSVEATDVNGEVLPVTLRFDAVAIAQFYEAAEQQIESEGGSMQDRWLADDPELTDWTVAEVAQATIRQLVETTKEVQQRAVYQQLVENPELLEQLDE